MFLKIRENESPFVRYDEEGFELDEDMSTNSRSSFVQITLRQSDEVNSDKASEKVVPSKRRRVKTACVPDAIDLLANDTEEQKMSASRIFNQKLIERLCSKLCPELLSEDVLNNSSFVDSVVSYVRPLLTYLERYENYKLMQVRERKDTETYKLVTSINDNVEFLKKKMYKASDRDKSSVWINEVNGISQSEGRDTERYFS